MRYWQAAGSLGDQCQVRVHFDADRAYVVLTKGGTPLLCREVDLPSDEYALSQKKLDVASAADFAERYLGIESVAAVKISGGGDFAQRSGMVSKEVELPIEKDASELPGGGAAQWGAMAAAGAGMRTLAANPLSIDFTGTGRMREEDKALIMIWSVGLLAFLVFTVLALVNEVQIISAKKELNRLTRKAAEAGVVQGMTASDLKEKIDRMKALLGTMEGMEGRHALAPKMSKLVDLVPDSVWLESITYTDPLVPGEAAKKTLQAGGAAQTGSREGDILSASQFKETLAKDEVFAAGFGKIDISFSGGAGAAAASGQPGAVPEKRTAFTLIAAQEK